MSISGGDAKGLDGRYLGGDTQPALPKAPPPDVTVSSEVPARVKRGRCESRLHPHSRTQTTRLEIEIETSRVVPPLFGGLQCTSTDGFLVNTCRSCGPLFRLTTTVITFPTRMLADGGFLKELVCWFTNGVDTSLCERETTIDFTLAGSAVSHVIEDHSVWFSLTQGYALLQVNPTERLGPFCGSASSTFP
ncbi:hypothetical protein Pla52o_49390 [Novipirellula galeiformis]|uniref:Uncharacterized protein n=1 Tax=Novipirellula galeiformis TaxID=2528004 RepID=A0A5C6C375_9BACT|nr:hypothetical protein Pla52o_49390 [Novipirellula galeiformis]